MEKEEDGMRAYKMIFRSFAVPNQANRYTRGVSTGPERKRQAEETAYLALASETLSLGLARSSLRRWLCSTRRLCLSSDMDCLPPPLALIVVNGG